MAKKKNYMNIGIDNLIAYTISKLLSNKEESTVERIVKECFALFPEKFSMSRYPKWPDSKKVHSALMRCRDKGWVTGNAKSGFELTTFGEKIAKKAEYRLKPQLEFEMLDFGKKKKNEKFGEKWELIKNHLKNSELYNEYKKNITLFSPDEKDIRKMLMCTLETPIRIIRQNLINSIEVSKEFNDKDLFDFLLICAKTMKIKLDKAITKF